MPYPNPGREISRRVDELIVFVNRALRTYYGSTRTDAKNEIKVMLSRGPGGKVRTPAEQAAYLIKGTSWTCRGSHMSDGAKHILVSQGGSVVWKLQTLATQHKDAWDVLVRAWNDAMARHDLRNYKGGRTFDFPGSDPLHMELPDSRLLDADPRVLQCLEIYANATRLEGKPKNRKFERGYGAQQAYLREYDAKLRARGRRP